MIIYKRKKKQLVIPCGLGPVVCPDTSHDLQMKIVDSSTVLQHIEPDEGYYGLYRVIINPLTDANLLPGNIKNGVEIFGVTGTYAGEITRLQAKTVDSSTVIQTVVFDSSYDGLSSVTVNPYTLDSKTVNPSTSQQIITSDEDGLSSVTVNAMNLQTKTYNPYTYRSPYSDAVWPDSSYDGLGMVIISTPEAAVLTVNSSTVFQEFNPHDSSNEYYWRVKVNPYTVEVNSSTLTQNGTYTFTPRHANALSSVTIDVSVESGTVINNQAKTVNPSTNTQIVTFDNGYTGLSQVTVNPNTGTYYMRIYGYDHDYVDASVTGYENVRVYKAWTTRKIINPSVNTIDYSPYDDLCEYYHKVTVNAVDASIDSNIQAGNIKNGVTILGVTGTYDGSSNWIIDTKKSMITNLVTDTEGLCNIMHGLDSLFFGVRNLETVEFTNSSCAIEAFTHICGNCVELTSASFPNLTTTDNDSFIGAFENCISLSNLDFPELTYIAPGAFGRIMCYAADCLYVSDASITFPKLADVGNIGMYTAFMDAELQSVNFPVLTRAGWGAFSGGAFGKGNPGAPGGVHAVSFPNLTTCEYDHQQGQSEIGTFAKAFIFNDEITSISFPSLVYGRDDYTFDHAFEKCTNLASISVPEFTSRINPSSICDCSSLVSITAHPLAIGTTWLSNDSYESSSWSSIRSNTNPSLTTVTLTYDITDNISFSGCSALSTATVKHILEHLDLTVSDKTCTFYVGFTITDDVQGSIQTAYNNAVNNGWTIHNLTIVPYS